jgi:hypothetical protein
MLSVYQSEAGIRCTRNLTRITHTLRGAGKQSDRAAA